MSHRLKDRVALSAGVFSDIGETTALAPGLRDHIGHAEVKKTINACADSLRQLQPEDVAHAIVFCVSQPAHVNINEILMRPTDQER
ncbi:NADP-dependent 3-hydroxy acid dehydrogenase YdfG [Rhodanobacter sp. ANJX3]|uniref:hypothetical protein n=1 Tax=Rhodanobacter sp. ANJX3 TaxID=2723083 RepID=UPI00178E63C7|nr:hypothetical protein [Rhodanobacter sp. ANJX3]MBB5358573.1 NADP-dependent 3-hydroxy acid dehydrogenase YdfG [Rhodanobacter sp. ANJX3]